MRRREFITLLGGAATAWPLTARAQRPAMPVVGFLSALSPSKLAANVMNEFRQGLKEAGFVEGQNIKIEYRWAEGKYDRLPEMASELARRGVALIVANTTPAALAAKAATTTIPIVFEIGGDPVALGLVANLSRPNGNLTGVALLSVELVAKRLELLHEVISTATTVGLLINPANPLGETVSKDVQAAANKLGLQLHELTPAPKAIWSSRVTTLRKLRRGALVLIQYLTLSAKRPVRWLLAMFRTLNLPISSVCGGADSRCKSLSFSNIKMISQLAILTMNIFSAAIS